MKGKEFLATLVLLLVVLVCLGGCGSNHHAQSASLAVDDQVTTTQPSPPSNNDTKSPPVPGAPSGDPTTTPGVISGHIYLWQGDFMPTVGTAAPRGTITPVSREVLVYRATTSQELTPYMQGQLYSSIPTELVAATTSNFTGFYQVAVPPGTYSIFVKEPMGYYANRTDGQGTVNRVDVLPGATSNFNLDITYQATF